MGLAMTVTYGRQAVDRRTNRPAWSESLEGFAWNKHYSGKSTLEKWADSYGQDKSQTTEAGERTEKNLPSDNLSQEAVSSTWT